ncbi:MAG: hypothetical protein KJT03_18455, partial [Verrucomicrobiae bacterium]|nr:hypothetical protein [Verrucomicrobiae bacterium]
MFQLKSVGRFCIYGLILSAFIWSAIRGGFEGILVLLAFGFIVVILNRIIRGYQKGKESLKRGNKRSFLTVIRTVEILVLTFFVFGTGYYLFTLWLENPVRAYGKIGVLALLFLMDFYLNKSDQATLRNPDKPF